MKRIMRSVWVLLLVGNCQLIFAQGSQQTATDYIARRIKLQLLNPPQQVSNASVSVSGNPGPATYFYWIVTNTPIGASSPAGPFAVISAPNTLSGTNFDQVSWPSVLGASNYDVLRTSTPSPPVGACGCAVATATTSLSVNDQSNSLNPYTVNPFDPSTVSMIIANVPLSPGVSQIIFSIGNFNILGFSSAGLVSTYNNQATAGVGITPVLFTVGLTAQTATIGTTNITTACAAGVYSVSFYLKTTTAGTAGTVSLTLNWNDGAALTVTSATASLTSTAAAGLSQGTQLIKCSAGSTLSYSTTVTGATGSPQYSLDIAVEQVK